MNNKEMAKQLFMLVGLMQREPIKKMQINMKQNSEKKNFLHKADRQNMPVCCITGKIYRKQEYEIKTETDCKSNRIDDCKHIKFGIV